jgi:hypothetical protein
MFIYTYNRRRYAHLSMLTVSASASASAVSSPCPLSRNYPLWCLLFTWTCSACIYWGIDASMYPGVFCRQKVAYVLHYASPFGWLGIANLVLGSIVMGISQLGLCITTCLCRRVEFMAIPLVIWVMLWVAYPPCCIGEHDSPHNILQEC